MSPADLQSGLGEYPNEFLGISPHTNDTTSTQENMLQAPLKLNSEAFSGANTTGASFHSGSGTPQGNLAAGSGSFYFRWDTPSTSSQRIYICTVGGATAAATTWVALAVQMAVTSAQISVGNTATQLVGASVTLAAGHTFAETEEAGTRHVIVSNGSGAVIYLGGANVTASGATGGASIAVSTTFPDVIPLAPTEALYAITASSTSTVGVLVTGN